MEKKNQLKSYCKNGLSSREVVARDLPHPMPLSLLNRKQQPYFMREAEDPGTLRAATPTGMTDLFYFLLKCSTFVFSSLPSLNDSFVSFIKM